MEISCVGEGGYVEDYNYSLRLQRVSKVSVL